MSIRLLVVDDDVEIQNVIKESFGLAGYQVDLADSVTGALELMENNEYDVLITDKNFPVLHHEQEGGMLLLKEVRQRYPATEVIMITGYATIETAIAAMKLGAFDYIVKPFRMQALIKKVARIIELKRFLNPTITLKSFKECHNALLEVFEDRQRNIDEKTEGAIKSMLSKLDDFFRAQQERERVILIQREALANISSDAEQLRELLPQGNEGAALLDRIYEHSLRRL